MTAATRAAGDRFRVALTFDAEHPDRPSAIGVAERLLDELDRLGVSGTFFVQGRWAEAYPDTARRIRDAGHVIGNHSHYHARMPLLSAGGLRSDIRTAEQVIVETMGVDPKPWFRCPFGAGAGDRRVQAIVGELGYRQVGSHVVGRDWPPERTGEQVEETIVRGALDHRDGTVVLLHTWPDRMLEAIPGSVARLRDEGATFVGVDALDEVPTLDGEGGQVATPA